MIAWLWLVGCGADPQDRAADFPLELAVEADLERLACDVEPMQLAVSWSAAYTGAPLLHRVRHDGQVLAHAWGGTGIGADGRPLARLTLPDLTFEPGQTRAFEVETSWPGEPISESVEIEVTAFEVEDLTLEQARLVGYGEASFDDLSPAQSQFLYPIGGISVFAWPTLELTLAGDARGTPWGAEVRACLAGEGPDAASCVALDTSRVDGEVSADLTAAGELGCAGPVDLFLALEDLPCAPDRVLPIGADLMLRIPDCDGDLDPAAGFGGFDCDDAVPGTDWGFWFLDGDGDGYRGGASFDALYGCRPTGPDWVPGLSLGSDCNPFDPAVLGPTTVYEDLDGDGFGGVADEDCTPPEDAILVGGDCDDTDAFRDISRWYPDPDGDGAGDGSQAALEQCDAPAPTGWVRDNAWGCPGGASLDGAPLVGSLQDALSARIAAGATEAALCVGGQGVAEALSLTLDGPFTLRNAAMDLAGPEVPVDHRRAPWASLTRNLTVDGVGVFELVGFDLTHAPGASVVGDGGCVSAGSEVTLVLDRSQVRECATSGEGGGIRASTLVLDHAELRNNLAENGAGARADAVTLIASTVAWNTASGRGGGLAARSVIADADSFIEFNDAHGGGGIALDPDGSLQGGTVRSNTADRGGGVEVIERGQILEGTTLDDNVAVSGGGLICDPCVAGAGFALRVEGVSFFGNTAPNSNPASTAGGVFLRQDGTGPLLDMVDTVFIGCRGGPVGGVSVEGAGEVSMVGVAMLEGSGTAAAFAGSSSAVWIDGEVSDGVQGIGRAIVSVSGTVSLAMSDVLVARQGGESAPGSGLRVKEQAVVDLDDVRFEEVRCSLGCGLHVLDEGTVTGTARFVGNDGYSGTSVYMEGGTVTLTGAEFTGNIGTFGSVAELSGTAHLTLVDSVATDNQSGMFGVVRALGDALFTASNATWVDNVPDQFRGSTGVVPLPTDATCDSSLICVP